MVVQIFKGLGLVLFLAMGLWVLFKAELHVRNVSISGIPARIIGFFGCVGIIASACIELNIISSVYKNIMQGVFAGSLIIVVIMTLLFSFINMFKQ